MPPIVSQYDHNERYGKAQKYSELFVQSLHVHVHVIKINILKTCYEVISGYYCPEFTQNVDQNQN